MPTTVTKSAAMAAHHSLSRAERSDKTATLLRLLSTNNDPAEAAQLREEIVMLNTRIAEAVAARYEHRGVAGDDLRQIAYEGLIKSVLRFDVGMQHDFLSFAVPTIRGELQRHFRDSGWTVRPPRRIQEIQGQATRAIDRLTASLGREPTKAEVAEELGVTLSEYIDALSCSGCFQPTSLDTPVGSGAGAQPLGEVLADQGHSEDFHDVEIKQVLAPVLRELPERDRRIIYLRFFEERSQLEIGAEVGVTQTQVSRLLARILDELRTRVVGAPQRQIAS